MNRRIFGKNLMAATAGLSAVAQSFEASANTVHPFKHIYAPHFGMFENSAGKDLVKQLEFMAAQGFRGLEDNGMLNRSAADQQLIGDTLKRLGMTMGVFVIDGGENWKVSLTTGKKEFLDVFVATCKKSVELAKRVNAKWMTIVPGYFDRTKSMGLQTANVVEAFRRGAEIMEPHGLVMVMEPLSDNPDLFLRHSDQSYEICKAVNSPACKILFDIYHMQRNEGNLIKNIDAYWSEIAYVQIGDNPGRKEPTSGEINYKNIFKHLYDKGYRGVMGMEHGNAFPAAEGELKLIEAYKWSDNF
ncbi:MAG: TIM barrel protein [Bacteroidota bacterium]